MSVYDYEIYSNDIKILERILFNNKYHCMTVLNFRERFFNSRSFYINGYIFQCIDKVIQEIEIGEI